MNESERRDRIVEYLRIKPINHGQVYTFQIAMPGLEVGHINEPRREELRRSLIEQGSNLIPLIVRRTNAYSELEEYEVVYGADWCIVAKELDIEKLWVWVFDMTDEQAAAAKIQMEQLLVSTVLTSPVIGSDTYDKKQKKSLALVQQLEKSVQKAEVSTDEVEALKQKDAISDHTEQIKNLLQQVDKSFQEVETLNRNIEQVAESVKFMKKVLIEQKEAICSALNIINFPKKDYNKMTVLELKKVAKDLNIKLPSGAKKAKIIEALEKADIS